MLTTISIDVENMDPKEASIIIEDAVKALNDLYNIDKQNDEKEDDLLWKKKIL